MIALSARQVLVVGKSAHGFQVRLANCQFEGMTLPRSTLTNPRRKVIREPREKRSQTRSRCFDIHPTRLLPWNCCLLQEPAAKPSFGHSRKTALRLNRTPQQSDQAGMQANRAGSERTLAMPAGFNRSPDRQIQSLLGYPPTDKPRRPTPGPNPIETGSQTAQQFRFPG